MRLAVKVTPAENESKACLLFGLFEGNELTSSAQAFDKMTDGALSAIIKQSSFQGKAGQTLSFFFPKGNSYVQVFLIGFGKADALNASSFRKTIFTAMKTLLTLQAERVVCYLMDIPVPHQSMEWKVKQIAEATWDGLYFFDLFKSVKENTLSIKEFIIHIPDAKAEKACELALKQAQAIANAVTFTKNLANLPSNICTPTFLADQARDLAKQNDSISVKILDEKEMQHLKMGALLGVSQGSAEDAKLICLEYKGASAKQAPVALVGKGVTFDTGGNSLKPADSMVGMKYDMCGAATVLGVIKAAAELKLPLNVVGVIPAVENMPGGSAYKPEDILTSMSGQTIEVISTDAEGRLALCDALTYCERYNPDVVIDIATLTGAVVIALGYHATALFSNNEKLEEDLLKAGKESNDRVWPMPLWEDYQEMIKSPFADMANIGGRAAGSITAACFLSRFAKKFHWAHLDIAGTGAMMAGITERMATGRPVPMLVQFLINRSKQKDSHAKS